MSDVFNVTETLGGWLSTSEFEQARAQLPVVYIEAIPVRVDTVGAVTHVGLLLEAPDGETLTRTVVSGRVHLGERVRDALLRHIEKDLGPVALPRIPVEPQPFTVVEYFPTPEVSGFHDPRQHAVSLAYVVPVDGDCEPSSQALEITWLEPRDAVSPDILVQMVGGRDRLLRMALGHVGLLP
jgi:ADP-ribose pyrophosphatase YjhB (NUDIX family)